MIKRILAVAAFILMSAGASFAQGDETVVKSVTMDSLKSIVLSLGHSIEQEEPQFHTIYAASPDGMHYSLAGTACPVEDCKGVNITVMFQRGADDTLEDVNRANLKFAAVSVWADERSIGVSRYVILDMGMTVENLKFNIEILLGISSSVLQSIAEK